MKTLSLIIAILFVLVNRAGAAAVYVDMAGTVVQNNYTPTSPLNAVAVGSPAHTSFQVDSNAFLNSSTFPVRGYSIIPASFVTTLGSANVVLNSSVVPPQPFFSVRNNDPAVDGFIISNGVDFLTRIPTNFSSAGLEFVCSYPQSTLSSLDILGAVGTYTTSGLSLLEWDLGVGESIGIDINYNSMVISVPEPASLGLLALALPLLGRRARRN